MQPTQVGRRRTLVTEARHRTSFDLQDQTAVLAVISPAFILPLTVGNLLFMWLQQPAPTSTPEWDGGT